MSPRKGIKISDRKNPVTVLIVEDSPTQRAILLQLLESHGYHVAEASHGREALKRIEISPPDLIISDIIMPTMDGYELCNIVKSHPEHQHIPVVLLTALTDRADIVKGLASSADGFITKPYSEKYLIEHIETILENKKLRKISPSESAFEVFFAGEKHNITANRVQITNLLLSTFENAIHKNQELNLLNRELVETKEKLARLNEQLEYRLVELKASEARFKNLVTTIPDIVYRIDASGHFTFINDAIRHIGYTPGELIGKHFSTIVLPADVETASREIVLPKYEGLETGDEGAPKLMDERRTGGRKTTGLEIRLVPKSKDRDISPGVVENIEGDLVTMEVNSSGMYEVNPVKMLAIHIGSVGVIRDITDRKRMEAALKSAYDEMELRVQKKTRELQEAQAYLIQSEKMTALGTLVAGIAHELNNPLMGILNFIQYCRKHTPGDDKKALVLENAEMETNRSIGIVKNLLTFSRYEGTDHETAMRRECITDVFDRVESLLRYRIDKENVVLTKTVDGVIPEIPMRVEEIQQVLLNIMSNALDALKLAPKEHLLNILFFIENGYVHIRVTDSGCGIAEEHIGRIFDPFFTTKPVGEGTGLGLSISRNIIERHGGTITCTSTQAAGTTAEISLPVQQKGVKR